MSEIFFFFSERIYPKLVLKDLILSSISQTTLVTNEVVVKCDCSLIKSETLVSVHVRPKGIFIESKFLILPRKRIVDILGMCIEMFFF